MELVTTGVDGIVDAEGCIADKLAMLKVERSLWNSVTLERFYIRPQEIEAGNMSSDYWFLGGDPRFTKPVTLVSHG